MRKSSLLLLGAVFGAGATTLGLETHFLASEPAQAASAGDTYRQLNLFGDAFEHIRSYYVEKPDDAKLVEAAINGMLTSLDPHSSYMDAKSFRDMQVNTKGEFGGLGIEVTMEDGLIKVISPIADTPAARAGILSGDIITQIDGDAVQGVTLNQAVDKMRGAVKTSVKLTIVRKDRKDPLELKLTREIIQVKSVKFHQEDDVGYVQITQFNEQTTENLRNALDSLKETSATTSSRAMYLICATIRAACSIRRLVSAIPSSTKARSSRRAVVIQRTPSAGVRAIAMSPRASVSWC